MTDYISREAVIEAFDDPRVERNYGDVDSDSVIRVIEAIPSADVREVKRGRWLSMDGTETVVKMKYGEPQDSCRCSVCGEWLVASDEYAVIGNYCPNCGAQMEA